MFVRVPEGKQVKNRVHLDLFTDDLDAEVNRIGELGADLVATITEGGRWMTMTDPKVTSSMSSRPIDHGNVRIFAGPGDRGTVRCE